MISRKSVRRMASVATAVAGVALWLPVVRATLPAPPDYWPMNEGSTWTFDTMIGNRKITQVIKVASVKQQGSARLATLEYAMGQQISRETYQVTPQSVERVSSNMGGGDAPINPPIPIIKYPLTAGKSWTWTGTITTMGQKLNGRSKLTVSGPTTVKTPAGTFRAMRVHSALRVEAQGKKLDSPNDYWFAPSVGMVRQSTVLGNITLNGTLRSYKLK
jgi:hypothetical protein